MREPASSDGCDALIAVVSGEDNGARPKLVDAADAGNQAVEGEAVRPVERQSGIVGDVTRYAACRPSIDKLERAGRDRGSAGMVVVACQSKRARARLGESHRAR